MTGDQPKYYSFLVRLWVVEGNHHRVWRASLEDPTTQEILGFETLQLLYDYLKTLTRIGKNET